MSSTEVLKVGLCHSPHEKATIPHTHKVIFFILSPLLVYSGAVCHSPALIFAGMQRATFDHESNKETSFPQLYERMQ